MQPQAHAVLNRKSRIRSGLVVMALLAVLAAPQATQAQYANDRLYQDVDVLNDRLNRMERVLKDVEREVYSIRKKSRKGNDDDFAGPPSSVTSVRIDELESLVRNLNGMIEQTRFENAQLKQQLDSWSGDVDFRLKAIEEKLGISPLPSNAQSPFGAAAPNLNAPAAPVDPNAPASTLGGGDRSQTESGQMTADQGITGQTTTGPVTTGQGGLEIPEGLDEHLAASMGVLGETRPSAELSEDELPPPSSDVPTRAALGTPDPVMIEGGQIDTTIQSVGPETYASLDSEGLPGTPGALYQTARNRLLAQDFAGAQEAFRVFLDLYADHSRAGEARYWLGESYYAQGLYKEAGQHFAQGLAKHPQNPKAPETLLKLGMSLVALGETKAGCKSFSEMRSRFPSAEEALALRADRERERAGCS